MEPYLESETRGLIQAWDRHDAATLGQYLVQAEQDPRINAASILSRHFLIDQVLPGRFADIREAELEFSMAMNWVLRLAKAGLPNERLGEVQYALMQGQDAADDIPIPRWITEAVARVTGAGVPSYVGEALILMAGQQGDAAIPDHVLSLFTPVWRTALDGLEVPKVSVLEPACGSANDYRSLAAMGLARLFDYTGLDLCEKNVRTPAACFPACGSRWGTSSNFPSPTGPSTSPWSTTCSSTSRRRPWKWPWPRSAGSPAGPSWVGFFQMHDGPDDIIRPYGTYHYNTLSAARTRDLFLRHAAKVEVAPIASLFRDLFGCPEVPNPAAYVLTAMMAE